MAAGDVRVRINSTLVSGDSAPNRVLSFEVVREGYRANLGETRPGTATIVFRNDTRLFDPQYTAGAFFSLLTSDAALWDIEVDSGSAWEPLISDCTLDSLIEEYDAGNKMATATVTLVDGLSRLAQASTVSPFRYMIENTSGVFAYFPLGESEQGITSEDALTGGVAGWAGSPRQKVPSLPPAAKSAGAYRANLGTSAMVIPANFLPTTKDWEISFWVSIDKIDATRRLLEHRGFLNTAGNGKISLRLLVTGAVVLEQAGVGGVSVLIQSTADSRTLDGLPHFWNVMNRSALGGLNVAIDAESLNLVTDNNPTFNRSLGVDEIYFGGDSTVTGIQDNTTFVLDEVYVRSNALLAEDRVKFNVAATRGFTGALSLTSVATSNYQTNWLLDRAGWVATRDIETSERPVLGLEGDANILDELRLLAATDGALIFVTRAGAFKYQISKPGTASILLRDDGTQVGYTGLVPERSATRVTNKVNLTPRGGATIVRSTGATPQRARDITTLHADLAQARQLAAETAARYAAMQTEYPSVVVMPAQGSKWTTVLPLELGQLASITRTPQGISPAITRNCVIEGLRHACGSHRSSFTTTISLGPPGVTNPFILDTSTLNGTDVLDYGL